MPKKYFPLVIIALGVLIYSNTFVSPFQFDDEFMLRFVADFESVKARLLTPRGFGYLTFAFNYLWHGRQVFGYHLVNLLVHLASALVTYFFTLQIFRTPIGKKNILAKHQHAVSLIVALIFVAHPLQTQAVTYIVQRLAAQAALFYLLGLWAYLKARLDQRPVYFGLAVVAFLAGLFTKTNAATWPAVVFLIELLFFTHSHWRTFLIQKALPIAAAAALPLIIARRFFAAVILTPEITPLGEAVTSGSYFLTQLRVIPKYIQLLLFPINQNLDYYFPISQHWWQPAVMAGFLFLSLLVALAVLFAKKRPLASFGLGWFFITLSVESSFIPIRDVIFEHRLYLPMVGFVLVLVVGIYQLLGYFEKKKSVLWERFTVVMAIVILVYSGLTFFRNRVWRSEISLMSDVVKKSPQKARGYNWLGLAHQKQGNLAAAKQFYTTAVTLNPNYQDAHNNLGNIYSYEGRLEQALKHFQQALQLGGVRTNDITLNIGLAYFNVGQYETALSYFTAVLEDEPTNNLAQEYIKLVAERVNQ